MKLSCFFVNVVQISLPIFYTLKNHTIFRIFQLNPFLHRSGHLFSLLLIVFVLYFTFLPFISCWHFNTLKRCFFASLQALLCPTSLRLAFSRECRYSHKYSHRTAYEYIPVIIFHKSKTSVNICPPTHEY